MSKRELDRSYNHSLDSIVRKIEESKHRAITSVNRLLIDLYWFIGKTICELQGKAKWGEGVVEKLSEDLRVRYPTQTGFSPRNLWDMKRFYLTYKNHPKLRPLVAEISWTNHLLILNRTHSPEEKIFYLKATIKERWSKRELERQLDSALFERFMLSKRPEKVFESKSLAKMEGIHGHLRDHYVLEFLDLSEIHSEAQLRKAILHNLRDFFLEFGKNLTFVGEEYPMEVDGEEFKVDLLFYHRELKCLVAVELKIGNFMPEYVGKMQFYLAALDEKIKLSDENPSIGLILCRTRKTGIVRLALSRAVSLIKVSAYETKLPNKALIKKKLETYKLPERFT